MSGKGTTLKGITVEIGGDTTKLGDAILKARKSASNLSGELRGVESLLKLDPTNTVLLAQKQDILAESIAGAKDKLKLLIAAQESMSKQLSDGKISPEQYRDFEREIESTRQQLTRLEATASGTDDAVADVGDAARDAGEKAEKASGGWSVLKGALADLAASAIKTAASAISDTAQEMITGAAEYGDTIDKMSQKMGMSSDAYQEWDFVLQHCGASIESLKPAMKTLATAAENGSDAFTQLGISQEQIAGMSQEQLFDATIAGLQNVTDETQRTYLAGKLLGRGATELGPLLNTSADDVADMRAQVHDLGGVMGSDAVKAAAAYQDSLQNMQYAFSGLKNNISGELLPTLTLIMDGITKMLTGGDEVAAAVGDLVVSLSGQLTAQAPRMMSVALTFIAALVTGLLSALPDLMGAAVDLVGALLLGIADQLPGIITAAMSALLGIVDKITSPESITLLIQAAMQLMLALARGLIAAIPQLIDAVPGIITNLVESFYAMLPEIIGVGIEIVIALASGLVSNTGHIIAAVPRLVETIVRGFLACVKSYWNIGKSIVDGIRQGIVEQWQRLKSDVSSLFTGLVSWIKNLLGIHSPSRVFADIGQNMAAGIGDGWASTIGDINRQIGESLQPQYVVGVDMQGLYAQAATLQTAAAPAAAGGDIAAVLERMDRLERAITGMQIYMDGDALVGSVATRMDYALGGIYTSKARRTI